VQCSTVTPFRHDPSGIENAGTGDDASLDREHLIDLLTTMAPDPENCIQLENYFLPGNLMAQIGPFVERYSYQRYHESLQNVDAANACFGRAPAVIKQRETIKQQTIEHRRSQCRKLAA
jgi:putative transposase